MCGRRGHHRRAQIPSRTNNKWKTNEEEPTDVSKNPCRRRGPAGKTKGSKRSQKDGEDASVTRGSIHPALRWGELANTRNPCFPEEKVGGQARAWSEGLGKGVSSRI